MAKKRKFIFHIRAVAGLSQTVGIHKILATSEAEAIEKLKGFVWGVKEARVIKTELFSGL